MLYRETGCTLDLTELFLSEKKKTLRKETRMKWGAKVLKLVVREFVHEGLQKKKAASTLPVARETMDHSVNNKRVGSSDRRHTHSETLEGK